VLVFVDAITVDGWQEIRAPRSLHKIRAISNPRRADASSMREHRDGAKLSKILEKLNEEFTGYSFNDLAFNGEYSAVLYRFPLAD
jgi:hypothetical protein